MKIDTGFGLMLAFLLIYSFADERAATGQVIRLSSKHLKLDIEQRGGQFVKLQLQGHELNPLSWANTPEAMPKTAHKDALYKGHFLCMGRIGDPSGGEVKAGVPMRGGQTGLLWEFNKTGTGAVEMACDAPLDRLRVRRSIKLDEEEPCFVVTEKFDNLGNLGRFNNILQHATIGPPFLSVDTTINTNATHGFNHRYSYPDPTAFEYTYPIAHLDKEGKQTIDIRQTSGSAKYLSKHIINPNEKYGWIVAYDPHSGLVIGYVWKRADYPWVDIWNMSMEGVPVAKGIEFGTTGSLWSYRQLLEGDTRFHGIPTCEYIDAGETIEKSYLCFLMDIGKNAELPFICIDGDKLLLNGKTEITNPFKEK